MSFPRFFAPDARLDTTRVVLPRDEAHHLHHVLRLKSGADVSVFDGRGHEWHGQVAAVGKAHAEIDLLETVTAVAEPPVHVTLAIGLLKGDQMDAVVRDSTMLGVSAIVPVVSAHVAVPSKAWRSGAAIERWRRIAVASAKQCGRAVVPEIATITDFETLFSQEVDVRLMCVEPSRGQTPIVENLALFTRVSHDRAQTPVPRAFLMIGPEGGWAREEIDRARTAGARVISLGPRTLRAETTPTVALAALWTMWGWH